MKEARFLAWARSTPWALLPEVYDTMAAVLDRWARGEVASPAVLDQVRADASDRRGRRAAGASVGGGVAVLPLYGVISQRGNALDDISGPGSTSTQMFTKTLREAVADESVGSIVLDVDSPGGSVYGIEELADEVYRARSKKPVIAVANSLAASAALWVSSQASELYVTPSGELGSIGVIVAHSDWSQANDKAGVKVTYITAGKYKAEMNPNEPLSEDARDYEQSRVDDYFASFTRGVARGRNVSVATVRGESWGEGRVLGAKQAVAVKMADGIRTFDDVIGRARQLAKAPSAAPASSSALEVHRAAIARRLRIAERS